ncbi:MAG: hypothetical protein JWP40_4684 [Blastococcus sp.]|jgi:hypothetical protein|nr:hypothetical protein [Blastococcus sp.]
MTATRTPFPIQVDPPFRLDQGTPIPARHRRSPHLCHRPVCRAAPPRWLPPQTPLLDGNSRGKLVFSLSTGGVHSPDSRDSRSTP